MPVSSQQAEAILKPALPVGEPKDIATNEGLYLAGLHLEQYRHATYSPVPYYEEALRRDPSDIRNNNALGLWYLQHGQFSKAIVHFQKTIEAITKYNTSPYEGEPFYNLGLTYFYQRNFDEAYKAQLTWEYQSRRRQAFTFSTDRCNQWKLFKSIRTRRASNHKKLS